MAINLFRLGVAIVLFGLLFPLVEFVDKYIGTGTASVTFILWTIGVILVVLSAFTEDKCKATKTN